MRYIPEEYILLVTVVGAVIIRIIIAPAQGFFKTLGIIFTGLFVALAFTDPIMHYFGIGNDMLVPVASLLTFMGDGIARKLIKMINNDDRNSSIDFIIKIFNILSGNINNTNNKDKDDNNKDNDK